MDPARIERLRNPALFPENADKVEILQTHLSVVCLSGDFAYKFKKAIQLPFADFSSLERRKFFCQEELRLNRRLCPEIYLDVVPLVENAAGELFMGESGAVIDYAVKMRRLPAEFMMDEMLRRGEVTHDHILAIADRIISFHQSADRSPEIDELGSPFKLRQFALANFDETQEQAGNVFSEALHRALRKRTESDFAFWMPMLERRREAGKVVDGHGDLHARNICLTSPVSIYDCIEFEPAFRCEDVATEHAFFLMDLRFRGHPELAKVYLDAVEEISGDSKVRVLAPLLMRYRAMVRAKVGAITAGEMEITEDQRRTAAEAARQYLRLSALLAVEEDGPYWFLFCGLPGSGKTTVAESLSLTGGWPMVETDRIRKELAGVSSGTRLSDEFYESEFSERVYETLISLGRTETATGSPCVVLDGNFRSRQLRERACNEAFSVGAKAVIVHMRLDEETAVQRLRAREQQVGVASDAEETVYQKLKDAFENPGEGEASFVLTLDGGDSPERSCDSILAALLV